MKRLVFAQYYDVTPIVNKMIESGELQAYEKDVYKSVFVCEDVHDFWVARIQENLNEDYEYEKGKYILERNKIYRYNLFYALQNLREEFADIAPSTLSFLQYMEMSTIVENLLILDDEEGLCNWDFIPCDSYEECLEILDDGFGLNYSLRDQSQSV